MKKHLTYLISLLLLFGLTVNECGLYSKAQGVSYYHVAFVDYRKERNNGSSVLYVYGEQLPTKPFFITLVLFLDLHRVFSLKVKEVLKVYPEQYRKIHCLVTQSIFLTQQFISSIQISRLYRT